MVEEAAGAQYGGIREQARLTAENIAVSFTKKGKFREKGGEGRLQL